jgi:adenylate kinase family enzyme
VKPSTLFVSGGPEQPVEGEEEEPPAEEEGDFKWLCKNGLAANIQLVKEEFCKERNLKPFKICIVGKPFTGKSFYAK